MSRVRAGTLGLAVHLPQGKNDELGGAMHLLTRFGPTLAAMACLTMVAACAAPTPPAPAPRPAPRPVPPPPPPRPAPQAADWRDIPLTPGDWRYGQDEAGSEAVFAMAGAMAGGGGPAFVLRCDRAGRRITITRPAGGGAQLRITTSSAKRVLSGAPDGSGVSAGLAASDPFLDAMVFSRGRFTVESESGAMLVIPAWPEPGRVVEDCRG